MASEGDPPLPRFDAESGSYTYDDAPVIEPAFIREAIVDEFDPGARNVRVRGSSGTMTFADAYPNGPLPSLPDAPSKGEESFDPLAEWRVAGELADDILISLPDGTPKMLRTLLTLLLGGMRGRSGHSQ